MQLKAVLRRAFDAMVRSYEGKRFLPSLILKLLMALAAGVITALFANTLFSVDSAANQLWAALFFYLLMLSVGKLVSEVKQGGIGVRLQRTLRRMVQLDPPGLWFCLAGIATALLLPYPLVLALGLLLFCAVLAEKNSLLLSLKRALCKGEESESSGRGLATFATGLLACGLVVCILANLGLPTLFGTIDRGIYAPDGTASASQPADGDSVPSRPEEEPTSGSGPAADVPTGDNAAVQRVAQKLMDRLMETAGTDREAFGQLFRNTEEAVIDQYYATDFDRFRSQAHSRILIAAQSERYVWFTALYYTIPKNYPKASEQTVYLTTVMGVENGSWKVEDSETARAELQNAYDMECITPAAWNARDAGHPFAQLFVPFRLNDEPLCYGGTVLCKAIELYEDENGDVVVTLYASNDTGKPVTVENIKKLTVTDGKKTLFTVNAQLSERLEPESSLLRTVTVEGASLEPEVWSRLEVGELSFDFSVEE